MIDIDCESEVTRNYSRKCVYFETFGIEWWTDICEVNKWKAFRYGGYMSYSFFGAYLTEIKDTFENKHTHIHTNSRSILRQNHILVTFSVSSVHKLPIRMVRFSKDPALRTHHTHVSETHKNAISHTLYMNQICMEE